MIVCKGCGGSVAKDAKACPECGKPTPAENMVQGVTTIVVLLIIAVGVFDDMSGGH